TGSPLVLHVARPQHVPVGNRSGIIERLFTGASVQTILEIRITIRNLLAKERPWLQKQVGDRRARTSAWNSAVKGKGAKEALWAKDREPRPEQRTLRAGPDRLEFPADLQSVLGARVGKILRDLAVLFVIGANTTHT